MARGFLIAAALIAVPACSSGGGQPQGDPFRDPSGMTTSVELRVDNLNFNDATILALAEGTRTRLGTVGGKSSRSFSLHWPTIRDLRVQIDLLAGDQFTTLPISVNPGDRLSLTIETVLQRSLLTR